VRKLINNKKVPELKKPVNLTILTKCPLKWQIRDLETGKVYQATGSLELYKQWKPIK
tara:strand:- start:10105 stop:10275 length:171 start_codon:yes stop_codon:yes gene_type:complete